MIAEYDGSNTLLRKFTYGPGIDKPICMIDVADSNTVYYYHFDGLGSVIALSDVNSVIVERYSYDVFGQPSNTSDVNNPYLFTGRRYDDETGLYYYRARYYDYATGRFLQTDPIGYGSGLNLYTYVGNNPLNWLDPWGLRAKDNIKTYDEEETKEIIRKIRRNWNPWLHGIPSEMGGIDLGGYDFAVTYDEYTVVIDGKVIIMDSSQFSNYLLGYMAAFHLGPIGEPIVKKVGDYYHGKNKEGMGNIEALLYGEDCADSVRDIEYGVQDAQDEALTVSGVIDRLVFYKNQGGL